MQTRLPPQASPSAAPAPPSAPHVEMLRQLDRQLHIASDRLARTGDSQRVTRNVEALVQSTRERIGNLSGREAVIATDKLSQLLFARESLRPDDGHWVQVCRREGLKLSHEADGLRSAIVAGTRKAEALPGANTPLMHMPEVQPSPNRTESTERLTTTRAQAPNTPLMAMPEAKSGTSVGLTRKPRVSRGRREAKEVRFDAAPPRENAPTSIKAAAPVGPRPMSTAPRAALPKLAPTAERLMQAMELTSKFAAQVDQSGKTRIVRKDGSDEAVPEKIKLDQLFLPRVPVRVGRRTREMDFRVSYLPDQGDGDLVLGPMVDSGTFGKVRPAIINRPDGSRLEVMVKEYRLTARRPTEGKTQLNKLGRVANQVSRLDQALAETAAMQEFGGPTKVHFVRQVGDKLYLGMDPMVPLTSVELNVHELGPMARAMGAKLAAHSKMLHDKGQAHLDGKNLNVLVNFEQQSVAHADFGALQNLGPNGRNYLNLATYNAPEAIRGEGHGLKQDSWTLGITLLDAMLPDLGWSEPLHLMLHPPFSQAAQEAENKLRNFENLRDMLLERGPDGVSTYNKVDLRQLRDESLQDMSDMGERLYVLAQRDEKLAAYIIEHLLDPNEARRHDSATAMRHLSALAREQQPQIKASFARLAREHRKSSETVKQFRALGGVLDKLEGK